MSEHIKIRQDNSVLEITFARPEMKNALSNAMYRAATEALNVAQGNQKIRVVLFAAEGDTFTAGNDLADFANAATGKAEVAAHGFIEALGRADKPIVAAVPGLAVGVGTTMLLHCDLVFVSEGAKLSTPFVNLALVPEAASSLLLPARIGYVRAFAMFALGEATAADGLSLGLVNRVLPKDQVLPVARKAARTLATRPLGAIVATKRLMRDKERILGRMAEEGAVFAERLRTKEAREAFSAFAERRQPDFTKVAHETGTQ
jgi:enoyl-CoA hydratase/carnithine racemase